MIGYKAGYKTTTGDYNNFIGRYSAYANTSGSYNAFLGSLTGRYNTTGSRNSFVGYRSGYNNITASNNVYLGSFSGYSTLGSGNVFLGYRAGYSERGSNRLYIDNMGTTTPLVYGKFDTDQVGINTTTLRTGYTLAIVGKAIATEMMVETVANWPDFVFEKTYTLPTLQEVETHILQKGHLENIPSAKEVQENGIVLGDMHAKLLQKIEELTLYVIEKEKKIEKQNDQLTKITEKLTKMQLDISAMKN